MNETVRLLWKPVAMLLGFAALGFVLRAAGFEPRAAMDAAGAHGPFAFVLGGGIACALGVPRQIVSLAGGYAFGFWAGAGLSLVAELIGCLVDFAWARRFARRAALSFLRQRAGGRLDRLDRFLSGRAFTATLTLRLLPVGNNVLLNLLAGVSGVRLAPFLLASAIGYIPQTAVFALAGAGAGLSSAAQLTLAVALLVVSIVCGIILLRRTRLGPPPALSGSANSL